MDITEVTETINIINDHKSAYEDMNSKRAESKSASEKNQFMKKRTLREIRRIAEKIKTSKAYTDHIGEDIEIQHQQLRLTAHLKQPATNHTSEWTSERDYLTEFQT